jgi:hypothetical protein
LRVGESRALEANEQTPGAIATYLWQVFPASAGKIDGPTMADTSIEALQEGEMIVRLTASDGLFQVVADCIVPVVGLAPVEIALTASPNPGETGERVRLTCQSTGTVQAISHTISQLNGTPVELVVESDGVVTFVTEQVGARSFLCFAESPDGMITDPVSTIVTIEESGNDRIPPRLGSRG